MNRSLLVYLTYLKYEDVEHYTGIYGLYGMSGKKAEVHMTAYHCIWKKVER